MEPPDKSPSFPNVAMGAYWGGSIFWILLGFAGLLAVVGEQIANIHRLPGMAQGSSWDGMPCNIKGCIPIMENQMEKKMENEMETREYMVIIRGN